MEAAEPFPPLIPVVQVEARTPKADSLQVPALAVKEILEEMAMLMVAEEEAVALALLDRLRMAAQVFLQG